MAVSIVGKGLLLKSDPIASAFRDEIKTALTQSTRRPRLVGILATAGAPSKMYADFTKKQCEELGFEFVLKQVGSASDASLSDGEGVEEAIIEANNDNDVDGIMVGTYTCLSLYIFCVPTVLVWNFYQRCITLSSECSRSVLPTQANVSHQLKRCP